MNPTQSQPTALPKHTPTPWRVETCYAAVALVDERGIIVAHFREPNATANALKVAALLSQVARLREGLDKTERMLTALATSELNIDRDRNRTPTRLAQRDFVWRAIESARALLAETQP